MDLTTANFVFRLISTLVLGALVGMERQWRQRMAGTRTNALVAAGASAFVMSGLLVHNDPTAQGRIVSYVVSGVGFLGAGVIFKDGANVRGLNTAATIWCSAAIGVLGGIGSLRFAVILAMTILATNIVLRPLAYRLQPVLPVAQPIETRYEIRVTLRSSAESYIRTVLLSSIANRQASLQAIHSEDDEDGRRTFLRAEVTSVGRSDAVIEEIVMHLSIQEDVIAVSWSVMQESIE
jgi:putative Mg2+ transporter-C (MgtC) family protein